MYWGNGMGGWGMFLMFVNAALFWGLLIVGAVWLVRSTTRGGRSGPAGQPPVPQQVLADRFARGEIDEEEYTRRLQVLRGAPGGL